MTLSNCKSLQATELRRRQPNGSAKRMPKSFRFAFTFSTKQLK